MTAEPVDAKPADDLRAKAREAVAEWPPLTGEQLTEIRRLFGPTAETSAPVANPRPA